MTSVTALTPARPTPALPFSTCSPLAGARAPTTRPPSSTPRRLRTVLEAARWSPSANNSQPWRFVVAHRGTAAFDTIVSNLLGFNQAWTPNAAALIVNIAETTDPDGKPRPIAAYDLGQAVAHLAVQAQHDGLHVHQMGGIVAAGLRAAFDLAENLEVVSVTASACSATWTRCPMRSASARSPRVSVCGLEMVTARSRRRRNDAAASVLFVVPGVSAARRRSRARGGRCPPATFHLGGEGIGYRLLRCQPCHFECVLARLAHVPVDRRHEGERHGVLPVVVEGALTRGSGSTPRR